VITARGEAKVVLSTQRWRMALAARFITLVTNLLYGIPLAREVAAGRNARASM